MSESGQAADPLPELDPEATAEILDVLDDLLVWRLADQRWERVGQILQRLASAWDATDMDGLRDGTAELELASPTRIHRIGATEPVPIPEHIRDRANHLVHAIRTGQAPADRPDSRPAGDRGGDSGERPSH